MTKWNETQIEKATKVTFDDMLRVGYDMERLILLAKATDDEMYQNDANTAFEIVARFMAFPVRDKDELVRFGKCLDRLHAAALRNNDAVGAIIVTKVQRVMVGEE